MLLLRNDLNHTVFSLRPYTGPHSITLEIQAIKILLSHNNNLCLFSCYCPHPRVTLADELIHYLSQCNNTDKKIICGDFNVRHTQWDSNGNTNNIATSFQSFIQTSDLVLVTPRDLNTRYDLNDNNYSTLDLTLVSAAYTDKIEIKTGSHLGSDHLPVLIDLELNPNVTPIRRRPKWKLPISPNSEIWFNWRTALDTQELHSLNTTIIDEGLAHMNEILQTESKQHFGLTKSETNPKINKSWWTVECRKQIALRIRKHRIYERHPTLENSIAYKKQYAIARRTIRKAKRTAWNRYTANLSYTTPSSKVWQMIRNINGSKTIQMLHGPLCSENTYYTSDFDKATLIGHTLSKTIGTHTDLVWNDDSFNCDKTYADPQPNTIFDYNRPISEQEFNDTIAQYSSGKGTAMGEDYFHKKFLVQLPLNYKKYILELFNLIWSSGQIPKVWKSSLIFPTPKPGKDTTNPENIRPISFLSCLGKLLEKLVFNRLYWLTEKNNILNATQCGFRKNHTSLDQVIKLELFIRTKLKAKQHTLVLFIDISKAFDSIHHGALIHKLKCLGLKGALLNYIENFLQNRSFKVTIGNSISDAFVIKKGLPQGSVLSPLLFSLFGTDLPRHHSVENSEYADDVGFYSAADSLTKAEELLQAQTAKFYLWCQTWGLTINAEKTKILHFHNTRQVGDTKPKVLLNGTTIPTAKTYKFLGMLMDAPTLTWKPHIESLVESCNKRLNMLKSLASKSWGADRRILMNFYKAYIIGKLNYGAELYNSAASIHKRKLETIQNSALRIITGAMRSTPIVALQAETQCFSLQCNREISILKKFHKIRSQPRTNLLKTKLNSSMSNIIYHTNWTTMTKTPFYYNAAILSNIHGLYPHTYVIDIVPPIPPWYTFNEIVINTHEIPGVTKRTPQLNNTLVMDYLDTHTIKIIHSYLLTVPKYKHPKLLLPLQCLYGNLNRFLPGDWIAPHPYLQQSYLQY